MMLTNIYHRSDGKYTLMKEQLGFWCANKAKVNNTIVVCSPYGNYKLRFCGEYKPKKSKITIKSEES